MRHAGSTVALLSTLLAGAWAAEPVTLTDGLALDLLKKTPAFSSHGGPRALTAITKRMALEKEGHILEFQWKEGARLLTGIAIIVRTDMPGDPSPWLARDQGWGVLAIHENKKWDDMMAELKQGRVRANEAIAIGDIRTLMAAEAYYQSISGGSYDEPSCLKAPWDCIPTYGRDQPWIVKGDFTMEGEKHGYKRRFHRGASLPAATKGGRAGLNTWAATAVPLTPGETGVRGFCGDASGRVCFRPDGSEPAIRDGACPDSCRTLE